MLKIIAAIAENGVIGKGLDIPWANHDDLKWFQKHTTGHVVVQGSKTFRSIVNRLGKPLPNRCNIILTRDRQSRLVRPGLAVVHDFEQVLDLIYGYTIWVIGGAQVYQLALPYTGEMYLTHIHAEVEGDTYFPEWNRDEWDLVSSERHEADSRNEFPFTWEIYHRKSPVLR